MALVFALLHSNFCAYLTRSRIYTMRNSVTNKLHVYTFLPFVLAQNALRVVIHGIVYSHEIVFTQPMMSDNVFCAIN
jgi:hypothetical protein